MWRRCQQQWKFCCCWIFLAIVVIDSIFQQGWWKQCNRWKSVCVCACTCGCACECLCARAGVCVCACARMRVRAHCHKCCNSIFVLVQNLGLGYLKNNSSRWPLWWRGSLPTEWPGLKDQRFMYDPRNPRNIVFVARVPDWEDQRPGWGVVAPYCTIPPDYLNDTPFSHCKRGNPVHPQIPLVEIPLAKRIRFLVNQHGQLGAIPPPLFWAFPPLESIRSGGAMPPTKGGISAILARYHMKTRRNACDTHFAILSRKGIRAIWEGYLALVR